MAVLGKPIGSFRRPVPEQSPLLENDEQSSECLLYCEDDDLLGEPRAHLAGAPKGRLLSFKPLAHRS